MATTTGIQPRTARGVRAHSYEITGDRLLGIAALVYTAYSNDLMRRRLEDTIEHGKFTHRERLFPALLAMFDERPVFGWGPVNNKYELGIRQDERVRRRRDAHNLVLEVLTATGLAGAIPFCAGIGLCVVGAWRSRRGAHGFVPFALCVVMGMANMSGNLIASQLLWLVLAYAVAASLRPREVAGPGPPAGAPVWRATSGWSPGRGEPAVPSVAAI